MTRGRICVVVPCYNEAERFDSEAFTHALSNLDDVSFVLVDDGSTDTTLEVLQTLAKRHPGRVETLALETNSGKAEAVRQGMLRAFGSGAAMAGYWDADLATPLEAIRDFVAVFGKSPRVDIVLGSRVAILGHTIDRRPVRHYAGRVFATLASMTLGVPVYDTQCGAKLLRCNERTTGLFADPFGSRWVFDVELLARYLGGGGKPEGIRELPLRRWTDVGGSKVRPGDFFGGVIELSRIRRRYGKRRLHRPSGRRPRR